MLLVQFNGFLLEAISYSLFLLFCLLTVWHSSSRLAGQYTAFANKEGIEPRRLGRLSYRAMSARTVAAMALLMMPMVYLDLFKPLAIVITLIVAGGIAFIVEKKKQRSFFSEFDSCLADALQVMSASLEAGLSLKDGLAIAASTSTGSFHQEVSSALRRYQLGRNFEEVVLEIRNRVPTRSCNLAFGAMVLGNRLGGGLATSLRNVAKIVREQQRVEGKLQALTAQGRTQAAMLLAAAPLMAIGMYLYDPMKMQLLTGYWIGQCLLAYAAISELIGILIISRMIRLEV